VYTDCNKEVNEVLNWLSADFSSLSSGMDARMATTNSTPFSATGFPDLYIAERVPEVRQYEIEKLEDRQAQNSCQV